MKTKLTAIALLALIALAPMAQAQNYPCSKSNDGSYSASKKVCNATLAKLYAK
jgi:hypothetical protein